MKATRILGLLTLVASLGLAACGGGGSGNSALPVGAPTSSVDAYTGPAPATADVQAFEVNLWNNIRGQNRCGQCHNATTPAQMPNFARSDNVNLAYAEANTVVNLAQPSTSEMVVKVSGGHNCWLADPSACGQILTTWISNWANATGATSATTVTLVAPPVQSVGQSLNFSSATTAATDYGNTIYTLTSVYCSKCHSSTANPATQQAPYFADPNITTAYQAAIPKIDFTGCVPQNSPTFATTCGVNSRFYQRLATDMHNCWTTCSADAALMLAQIQAFAMDAAPTNLDPSLVVSKALTMTQGTVASGANRYDADTIAKYMFSEGAGSTVAYDTSGIDPAADLTLTGHYQYDGSWGVIFLAGGGKAQATVQASSKLNTLIQATGEFSIEAWVTPAVVATNLSDIVSYSGGDTLRNFTLAQTNQDYDFQLRSSNSMGLNGMPQLQTPDATMALQAALQHVVLTYDPINGRQIYVNGVNQNIPDPQKGGTLSNWDSTFALVLGSEVSGDNAFQGEIKFLAIHQRALTAAQIMQNFNAGVGQRYYLLFNISNVPGVNVPQAYMMFTVSQYDNYSYLFYPADVHLARSDGEADHHSRPGHAHRHQRHDSAGGSGLHPAEYVHHGRGIHGAGRGPVQRRHGDSARERAGDRPVLPAIRPARYGEERDRRCISVPRGPDHLHAGSEPRAGDGRCRCAQLRAGELDLRAAHRCADIQCLGGDDLSERAAAAAGGEYARGLLLRGSGRCRAARGAVLQPSDEYPRAAGQGVPGRDLRRLHLLERHRHQPECRRCHAVHELGDCGPGGPGPCGALRRQRLAHPSAGALHGDD